MKTLQIVEDGVVTYDVCDELDKRMNNLDVIASIVFAIMPAEDKVEDLKEYLRMATPFGECEECGKYHNTPEENH